MTNRFQTPRFSPNDDDGGGVLDSATLDFFETGATTTRKATFTTEAKAANHTNPVVADGDGRFAAIFLDGSYRVILKEKDGTQVWDEDIVDSIDVSMKVFNTVAAMVAATDINIGDWITVKDYASAGSGTLFFKAVAAATGTADGGSFIDLATHQAQQNFPSVISVKAFGALGDGTGAGAGTDDSTAIDNTFDYVIAQGGGTIEFPFATYVQDTTMSLTPAGIPIKVIGNNSKIDHVNSNTDAWEFTGTKGTDGSDGVATVLDSNIAAMDYSFLSALSVVEGDLVLLQSDKFSTPNAILTLDVVTTMSAIAISADSGVFNGSGNDVDRNIIELDGSGVPTGAALLITANASNTSIAGFSGRNTAFSSTTLASGRWAIGTLATWERAYFRGEFHEVENQAGTTITVLNPSLDEYLSAETDVFKVTPCRLIIEDLTIECNSAINNSFEALSITLGSKCQLKNVHTEGTGRTGISFVSCYSTSIVDGSVKDALVTESPTPVGLDVGLGIESCQNTRITGGRYVTGRHGISLAGQFRTYNTYIADLEVGSSQNLSAAPSSGGFDTHTNVEFTVVDNCTIYGGVIMESFNWEFTNCRMHQGDDNSSGNFVIFMPPGHGTYMRILDCFQESGASDTLSNGMVQIRPDFKNSIMDEIIIDGGNILSPNNIGVVISAPSDYDSDAIIEKFAVTGNCHIESAGTGINVAFANSRSADVQHVDIEARVEVSGNAPCLQHLTGGASDTTATYNIRPSSKFTSPSRTGSNIDIRNVTTLTADNVTFDGGSSATVADFTVTRASIHDCRFLDYTATGGLTVTATTADIHDNDHSGSSGLPSITETAPRNSIQSSITLTTSQVNNLRGTPIQLVPAPGAGFWIEFVSAELFYNFTTTAFTVGADEDFVIQYDNSTDVTASIESAGFIDQTNDEGRLIPRSWTITTDIVALVNKKLEIFNTGAGETSDGGTSTIKVVTNYRILATGL